MVLKSIKSLPSESSLGSAEKFIVSSKPSRWAAENPPRRAEAGILARQAGLMAVLSLRRLGEKLGWSFLYSSIRLSAEAQKSKSEVPVPA